MSAYDRLAARFARIATLGEASSVLGWDASAMMPPGGAAARGDQLAVLAGLGHEMLVAPEMAAALDQAEARFADPGEAGGSDAGWRGANLALMRRAHTRATALPLDLVEAHSRACSACETIWRGANLALMRRAHTRATALPLDLVEAHSRACSACETIWRVARPASDFAAVAPALAEVVRLTRETADALAPALGLSPYDAMMDGYQPGIGSADVAPVFARYERFLADALPRALERQDRADRDGAPALPRGPFAEEAQEALCRRLSRAAGLEAEHARLDRSAHPFCGGTPTDVRITTRYDVENPVQALMGVMHETGHALYERGLPEAWARQPVGASAGMAAHESQSLILEMQACLSDPYLGWLAGELNAALPGGGAGGAGGGEAAGGGAAGGGVAWSGPALARSWRRVERSLIRVEADEMTYPAHVILRFRLEQALVGGDLAVPDLPGAWSDGLHALLGIRPPNDRLGCLQDIHWYDGLFGYFPSYTLGAMAAAQLMAAARRDTPGLDGAPGLDEALGRGDLAPLLGWLRSRVHGQGARLGFSDLLRAATGRALDPADFEGHLAARYL